MEETYGGNAYLKLPRKTLGRLDAARGALSRSEYVYQLLMGTMGSFPAGRRPGPVSKSEDQGDHLSGGQQAYVTAFEKHLRTDSGIDTALDIATDLGIKLSGGRRCNKRRTERPST